MLLFCSWETFHSVWFGLLGLEMEEVKWARSCSSSCLCLIVVFFLFSVSVAMHVMSDVFV